MSYDIDLDAPPPPPPCPHCGRAYAPAASPDLPNPTYNLTPIFDLALSGDPLPNPGTSEAAVVLLGAETDRPRGLRLLSGRKAGTTSEWIERALGHLKDPTRRTEFAALEPDNGWGTLKDAVFVLEWLLRASREVPEHTWRIR